MSKLRPTLRDGSKWPCMTNGTAYLMIHAAVDREDGLIHGALHDHGASCAIGSYFNINGTTSLPSVLIDEVAAVNDSVPHLTPLGRKKFVSRWLKWKLTQLGMPGFNTQKATK